MKSRVITVAIAATLAISLLGAPGASAATEFGSTCTANRAEEGTSFSTIQLSENSGAPTTAPVSGVVTKWKIRLVPIPISLPEQLKVYRPTANPSQFQVVGESAVSNVGPGENTFPTRIPIQAGDRLGLFGNSPTGTLFCAETPESESPGNVVGIFPGNPPPGSTATLAAAEPGWLVPAVAVIEADADNDGFGDETQDQCPGNAAIQTACPLPVTLATFTQVKKGSVTVVVTPSAASTVSVKGLANLGKGKKATLRGGTQILAPGLQGKFKLFFPKKVKTKLKELSPNQKLMLKVTVSGTNATGAATAKTLKVKLKGQAKP
jgi:hypothetical protein